MPKKRNQNDSDDDESVEGDINDALQDTLADWGKTKFDYYYTDYVDKDYPSSLAPREERLAELEQDEALRLQKSLLSALENTNYEIAIDDHGENDDIIDFLETQNRNIIEQLKVESRQIKPKRKKVKFDTDPETLGSDQYEFNSDASEDDKNSDEKANEEQDYRKRRPINMAIRKNRGLTPYKKKEYRNPRVKHKLKYKKALSKRRHLVKEAQTEYHRYSGEATGIKTSTIRSIKLD